MERRIAVLLAIVSCTAAENREIRAFLNMRSTTNHNGNAAIFKLNQANGMAPIVIYGVVSSVLPLDRSFTIVVLEENPHAVDCLSLRPMKSPNGNRPFILPYRVEMSRGSSVKLIITEATLERNRPNSIRGRAIGIYDRNAGSTLQTMINARSLACGWVDNSAADTLPLSTFRSELSPV